MNNMSWESILEAKHELEKELKAEAMIYQAQAKREVAKLLGVQSDIFFYLPYDQWSDISRLIHSFKEKAWQWAQGQDLAKAEYTLGEIWTMYKIHCEANSIPTELEQIKRQYA